MMVKAVRRVRKAGNSNDRLDAVANQRDSVFYCRRLVQLVLWRSLKNLWLRKDWKKEMKLALLMFCLMLAAGSARAAEQKIELTPDMVINETGLGNAALLVDEQAQVGDPANGKGQLPAKPFFPGWTAWYYPAHVVIDLGVKHHVTRVFLYNETGQNELVISSGTPVAWKPQNVMLDGYRNWKPFPVEADTRYLRLTLLRPTSLPEIVVYGERLPGQNTSAVTSRIVRTAPPMEKFIGANVFIDDPIDKIATPIGFAREYHSWGWDVENNDHLTRFQPSAAAGGNAWFFDDYYAKLKARNVTVSPAIQGLATAFYPGEDVDHKPVDKGKDTEAPASYARHAAHLYQVAARYGHHAVADNKLTLAPGQPRKSGLGALSYIENWNEPDKNWRGREGMFTPYELAAMSSADYDGDQGRMGANVGVKLADPNMRLVLGGFAGLKLDYLRAMKLWADTRRGGSFPADILNFHHYSSTGDEQGFQPNGSGISPEADHLREKSAALIAFRNRWLPDKEVWITEFGYDTNSKSPLHAPAIGTLSAEQVQGAWLIRSYLALAAAGVDRAAMFMLRDVKSDGGGVFETCGLVTEKGKWEPKPSWYYVATLKHHLTGMRYAGEVASGRPDVLIYRFRGAKEGTSVYAVWCPTSEDKHVANYRFPQKVDNGTQVTLVNGKTEGSSQPLPIINGVISLAVSETPILLRVTDAIPGKK